MAKEPEKASKPTWEEIVESANDPAMVHALAAKHGLKVVQEGEEAPPVPEKREVRKPDNIIIDKEGDVADSIEKAFHKLTADLVAYVDGKVDLGVNSVKSEVETTNRQAKDKEINDFVAKAKEEVGQEEYAKIFQDFNTFYQGGGDIERAWNKAKAANGINKVDEGDGKKEGGTTRPKVAATPPSVALSSADEELENENPKPVYVEKARDAAERHLKELVANEGDSWLS